MNVRPSLVPTPDRRVLLESMPRQSVCAEIGVWKGEFSRQILDNVGPSKFVLIDPWTYQPKFPNRMYGGKVAKNQDDMDAIYEEICETLDLPNVEIMRCTSEEAASKFDDETFDWVYIDGNHYFDYVRQDLDMWLPKIKPGGHLTGDDYLWRDETGRCHVAEAVSAFLQERPKLVGKSCGNQFMIAKPIADE